MPTRSAKAPLSVDQPFPDILTLLRDRAAAHPDAPAIEDAGQAAGQHPGTPLQTRNYAALRDRVEALAAQFGAHHKGTDRPRIGIVMPNGAALSETLLAATAVGTALPFNPTYTGPEFETYFADTAIDLLVIPDGFAPAAQQAAARAGLVRLDPYRLPLDGPRPTLPAPDPDSPAMVLLTSGSTGRPKRVPLSHRNVCTAARDVSRSLALGPQDRCLSMWELFHVGGLVDLLLAPLHSGGTVIATPGFEARRFFDLLHSTRPTWYQAVPTALGEIALLARRDGYSPDGGSLRLLRSVAAALSPALMAEVETLFRLPVITTFGMTEAAPLICSTGLDPADRPPGSVGRSCGTEIGIFDDTWQRLPDGREGEVAIRGPNVFSGYEADPAANAAAFRDGWFRTGDLGRIDDAGRLFLTGRIKELVNRGGEKINLREVDDALLAHPAVFEAAAFPLPHRTLGEDVAAAIVLRPGIAATPDDIRTALSARLAAFKVPRRIDIVAALPRNAVGKIDRRQLAEDAQSRPAAPDTAAPDRTASDLENRIAAIWARELGLAAVGPLDDFVRLGGDSLAALRVLMAVESETGLALPDDTLSRIATVRAMADALGPGAPDRAAQTAQADAAGLSPDDQRQIRAVIGMGAVPVLHPGSLFKVVNPDGTRPPLIWFFNRPDDEMRALRDRFPADQPLYGGFSGGRIFDMTDATMERLARLYLAELLTHFPTGDFILGGNCKGARLAWEIARLLPAAGRGVDRLCLVEYAHPDLTRFDRPLLLLFGKQSRRRAYRDIRWGDKGWDRAFLRPPAVAWIDGAHGEFFQGEPTDGFLKQLRAFLDGQSLSEGTLATPSARRILALHRNAASFGLYRLAARLRRPRARPARTP